MPAHHWARNFQITSNDIEYLSGLLLEREQPLSTETLAGILIEERLAQEVAALKERFKDARFYNPAERYDVGQRIIFPALDYASGSVVSEREGLNPEYETFTVIKVQFDNGGQPVKEYASALAAPHSLSRPIGDEGIENDFFTAEVSAEELMADAELDVVNRLDDSLHKAGSLVQMAGLWFPRELLLEVNIGHINLAEAVLDMNGGGPLSTEDILREIGELGSNTPELEAFSLNYVLKDDNRFDEVGPKGSVMWYLRRLEPEFVREIPAMLKYTPIDYDRALLDGEMLDLEREIDDELSNLDSSPHRGSATVIYPHRRMGTLPLNAALKVIFPTGQKTERTYVILVDGQDGEEYPAWVLNKGGYVYGLNNFYRKHRLPIGTYVTAAQTDSPGKFEINFNAYKPRSEWVRIIVPRGEQFSIEESKRAIGADYDDLMVLGADELEQVDHLFEITQRQSKTLAAVIRSVITALIPLTAQGTVHAKTIYSAVNVLKRCPPGPILATLSAHPDFENVGGHYWKLSSS